MAAFTLKDPAFTLNGTDLKQWVTSVTLKTSVDAVETTASGAAGKTRIGGLPDFSLEVEFNQDFAGAAVDATIWPLVGTVVPFTLKPTSAATSATNPQYSGSVLIAEYTPLDGKIGDLASVKVSWPGSGFVTRATA